MRSGRLRHSVILQKKTEIIPDPGFNDVSQWDVDGTASITGGHLVLGADDSVIVSPNPYHDPSVGVTAGTRYYWTVEASYPANNDYSLVGANNYVFIGGLDWEHAAFEIIGEGSYSGQFTPSGDSFIELRVTSGLSNPDVGVPPLPPPVENDVYIERFSVKYHKDIATVYAAIEPVSSRKLLSQHQYYSDTTHKVTLRYSSDIADIDNTWLILFGDRTFIITGVIDINERNQTILLHCREGVRESNEPAI